MKDIKLQVPFKHVCVTQPFSVNYLDFYQKMGLDGHPGIDFKAKRGCEGMFAHDGYVKWAGIGKDGGLGILIVNNMKGNSFGTFYYHHLKNLVKTGDYVKSGQVGYLTDNTGKYTTGDHEHFELFKTLNGNIINRNNGYNGRINPASYFNRNWDKSRAYHRYGRKRTWIAEYWFRFAPIEINNQWSKGGRWIHKKLLAMGKFPPILSGEQVNAIIYGGWDSEAVINPAMAYNWKYLKKSEYLKGEKPFI